VKRWTQNWKDNTDDFYGGQMAATWNRLPREAVAVPCLAVFQAGLDGVLSNLL